MAASNNFIIMAIFLLISILMLASGVEAQNNTTSTYSTPAPSATPTDASSSANTLTSTVALFGALIAVCLIQITVLWAFADSFTGCGLFVIEVLSQYERGDMKEENIEF